MRLCNCGRTLLALGWLMLVMLSVAPASADQARQGDSQAPTYETAQHPPPPASVASDPSARPDIYPYSCEHPQHADQENLCIQRRAVKVAEKQATWAKFTFIIGCAGTAAVVATLAFTAVAARATQDSVKVAERALTQTERAFVYPAEVRPASHLDASNSAVWWSFRIVWKNSGSTPTRNLRLWTSRYLEPVRMPADFSFSPDEGRLIPTLIRAGRGH